MKYSKDLFRGIEQATRVCHEAAISVGWWHDVNTGQPLERNKGELLMLIVSEIAEVMEGERKNLMDNHLTHRKAAEVELADTLIRIFDYAGRFNYDLAGAILDKLEYNAQRTDHRPDNRRKEGGKAF